MDLLHPQLRAFTAVLEEGSFEAAGRKLYITTSAVSQRIKALEDRLGQVLVLRQPPCRPTPAGELLLRRVRPMQALEAEALADFLPEKNGPRRPIAIAVNSDSLDTWFLQALATLSAEYGYLFDVRVDDQDHTLELIRNGSVLGAVTADPAPLQGCEVQALGIMRYQAIASPEFVTHHFGAGVDADALDQAPMIVFNRKDELQWRFIRQFTDTPVAPPIHYLPTSTGFVKAAALGLGWCLAPESLINDALAKHELNVIAPGRWLDVPLYWQHAAIRSETLQNIGTALQQAARTSLHSVDS